jgi:hypothetical protein
MIMPINKSRARQLAQTAPYHLKETNPDELERARNTGPATFHTLKLKHFLAEYCWVVCASGFKFAIIEAKFPALQSAFKDFDPAALSRMRSIRPVLGVFNNGRKAKSFLTGAQTIIRDGFIPFKQRLRKEGAQALETLPGIGPITKDHLAKNIGLADVPKADRWLDRAAELCEASVPELTSYVANHLGESQHVIDVAIWTYGKDGLLP